MLERLLGFRLLVDFGVYGLEGLLGLSLVVSLQVRVFAMVTH